jgi:hypothetical protein
MRYVTDHQYDEQYAIPETDEETGRAQSAEERSGPHRISKRPSYEPKAEYVDLIDALDSASAELGQLRSYARAREGHSEAVNNKASDWLADRILRYDRYFKRAVE